MRYTTVLFDADGTLLDFARSEDEAVRETMRLAGIEPDDTKVATYSKINDGLWKMLERKEIEKNVLLYRRFELFCEHYGYTADARKMATDYMELLSGKGYLLDGARELLLSLHGRVKMYIITNGVDFIQRRRYAKSGISDLFDGIFISGELGFEKPDPKYFECVEQALGTLDRESTLVVGDSLTSDIKGANNYSLDSCWFNPKKKPTSDIAVPSYVATTFDDVYSIIEKGDI
ncbi:MAG: YjjG family noncanonical pyrimidine nucleotidase [Clostridia bacterium]|nr:YjjG family noncanonical pyrimidine nucleotidase [Clostridia bacterium]